VKPNRWVLIISGILLLTFVLSSVGCTTEQEPVNDDIEIEVETIYEEDESLVDVETEYAVRDLEPEEQDTQEEEIVRGLCLDTDGSHAGVKGTTTKGTDSFDDICLKDQVIVTPAPSVDEVDELILIEYYCQGGSTGDINTFEITCEIACEDGACVVED